MTRAMDSPALTFNREGFGLCLQLETKSIIRVMVRASSAPSPNEQLAIEL